MKLKKVICLTTAIIISALSLVGCGGNEKKKGKIGQNSIDLKVIGGFKMKLKKVICLTTAIIISALSLVGCGGNEKKMIIN